MNTFNDWQFQAECEDGTAPIFSPTVEASLPTDAAKRFAELVESNGYPRAKLIRVWRRLSHKLKGTSEVVSVMLQWTLRRDVLGNWELVHTAPPPRKRKRKR